jgi:hypothetical protein
MNEHAFTPGGKRHRFLAEITGHAVWLYFRFALSYSDVEEPPAACGVILTYETITQCAGNTTIVSTGGERAARAMVPVVVPQPRPRGGMGASGGTGRHRIGTRRDGRGWGAGTRRCGRRPT